MKTTFINNGIGDENDSLRSMLVRSYNGLAGSLRKEYYADLYANSWIARKVCEYYPCLMANVWGKINLPDANPKLLSKLKNYTDKLRKLYREGQILANIYGGATFVRLINDGRPLDEPIDYKNISEIEYSNVFDRWDVVPLNLMLDDYYTPKYYSYYTDYGLGNVTGKVHKDRVVRFRGNYLPPELMKLNDYWEESVLAEFLEPYARYYASQARTLESVRTAEIFVVGIEDLDEADLNVTKSKQSEIQKELTQNRLLVKNKDTIDVDVLARKFAGIKELLENAKREMVASSGLTMPQLYQEFPSGFQATGESELIAEANALNNKQENKWGDLMRTDVKILMALFGKESDEHEWTWNNPYFNTPRQEAEIKLNTARTDQIYHQMNSLSSEEIRTSHFGNSEYEKDITIEEDNEINNFSEKTESN